MAPFTPPDPTGRMIKWQSNRKHTVVCTERKHPTPPEPSVEGASASDAPWSFRFAQFTVNLLCSQYLLNAYKGWSWAKPFI